MSAPLHYRRRMRGPPTQRWQHLSKGNIHFSRKQHTHTHTTTTTTAAAPERHSHTCDVGVLFCSSGTMKVQHSQHDDTTVTGKQIHPVCRACTSVQFKRRNDAMARGSVGVNTYLGFGWGTSTFHFVRKTPSHHITHHHTLQQHQQNG